MCGCGVYKIHSANVTAVIRLRRWFPVLNGVVFVQDSNLTYFSDRAAISELRRSGFEGLMLLVTLQAHGTC